jgi:hypothetical protein
MLLGTETIGQTLILKTIDSRLKFLKKQKPNVTQFIDFPSAFSRGKKKSTLNNPTPK